MALNAEFPSAKDEGHVEGEQKEISSINVQEIISSLPQARALAACNLCQYQGFWFDPIPLEGTILAQQKFEAKPSDIIVTSPCKSGTTWLKALIFSVVTRNRYDDTNTPLLTKNPHACIPFYEIAFLQKKSYRIPDLPFFSTHAPFSGLPKTMITTSECKIVYICRDPKDAFVSLFHFVNRIIPNGRDPFTLEEAFEYFCQGLSYYGPYLDHALEYWNASLEMPEKVLFLKYEELKNDTVFYVKRLAEFVGYTFTSEEEENGEVHKILELCSFEKLKNLEVNKTGKMRVLDAVSTIEHQSFFRKGLVGDWKNHLTPEMATRLDEITDQKCKGSGLSFNVS